MNEYDLSDLSEKNYDLADLGGTVKQEPPRKILHESIKSPAPAEQGMLSKIYHSAPIQGAASFINSLAETVENPFIRQLRQDKKIQGRAQEVFKDSPLKYAFGETPLPEDEGMANKLGHIGANVAEFAVGMGAPIKTATAIMDLARAGKYAKNVASTIAPRYAAEKEISKGLYDKALEKSGNTTLGIKPKFKSVSKILDDDVEELAQSFYKNPNLENAHELQKYLGAMGRKINVKDVIALKEARKYGKAQKDVKGYIDVLLNKKAVEAKPFYEEATKHYATKKLPYQILHQQLNKIPQEEWSTTTIKNIYRHLHRKAPQEMTELGLTKPIIPKEIREMYKTLKKREAREKTAKNFGLGTKIGTGAGAGLGSVYLLHKLLFPSGE